MTQQEPEHWLARYANNYHTWSSVTTPNGQKAFQRPMGLVEYSFDTDGTEYGGRADLNTLLTLELSHDLPSKEDIRRRITLAWASLRLQHPMIMSRSVEDAQTGSKRRFIIDVPGSREEAVNKLRAEIV